MPTPLLPPALVRAFRVPAFEVGAARLSAAPPFAAAVADDGAAGGAPAALRRTGLLSSFAIRAQEHTNWCWAGVTVSVAAHYDPGTTWTQCGLAEAEFGVSDCCGALDGGSCNQYWSLNDPLARVGHLRDWGEGPTPFADVATEVDAGNPLGCRVAWSGGGAHFVVLRGYSQAPAGSGEANFVSVADPWGGVTSDATYEDFSTAYQGTGSWTHTYFCEP